MAGARAAVRRPAPRPGRGASLVLALSAAMAGLSAGSPARADLIDDAARLVRKWSISGARVARLPPVFVEHGRRRLLTITPPPPPPGATGGAGDCVTVAFLAHRVAEFTLEPEPPSGEVAALEQLVHRLRGQEVDDERRVRSVAGAASVTRCGAARAELRRVVLDLLSPRAAVEVVVAASDAPPERIESIFPERVFGPTAPRGDPGRPIEPGPLSERVGRAARRARAEGAARVVPIDMQASDARLDFCLGAPALVDVSFLGASGPVKVVLSDAQWPISPRIPAYYGARARGGLAAALRRRRAPEPRAQTIAEAVGVQGETLVPVAIEPGRCYFAAVALIRGDMRSLRLSAELGDRAARDDAGERAEGAGVAFCAETEESALVRVIARGSSPWWVLALWPMD